MEQNRIDVAFQSKEGGLLTIYFTAGYPNLDDTVRIASALEEAGADIIEIGLPYSDPIADGPTIQESSTQALKNGMSIMVLFEQLKTLRDHVTIPVLLMGYLNPVIQFGVETFCEKCNEVGVDGLILPDLPIDEYAEIYKPIFDKHGLHNVFLVSPQTSETRIRMIDEKSTGFIYLVSSSSITGAKQGMTDEQVSYFKRIESMDLKSKKMIGFGISSHDSYKTACEYSDGAIIGSAFIRELKNDPSDQNIHEFVKRIKSPEK